MQGAKIYYKKSLADLLFWRGAQFAAGRPVGRFRSLIN